MNSARIKAHWPAVQRLVKQRWKKLSQRELVAARGRKRTLLGLIQKKYPITQADAEKQLEEVVKAAQNN